MFEAFFGNVCAIICRRFCFEMCSYNMILHGFGNDCAIAIESIVSTFPAKIYRNIFRKRMQTRFRNNAQMFSNRIGIPLQVRARMPTNANQKRATHRTTQHKEHNVCFVLTGTRAHASPLSLQRESSTTQSIWVYNQAEKRTCMGMRLSLSVFHLMYRPRWRMRPRAKTICSYCSYWLM